MIQVGRSRDRIPMRSLDFSIGLGGPLDCEMSRLVHFLDSRLTDGGKVVSLMRWLPFTHRKIPGTLFC
jgi:hypothetical protein